MEEIYCYKFERKKIPWQDKLDLKFVELVYISLNKIVLVVQKLFFSNKDLESARKILIFRIGSMGDSICALPAIYSIRKNYPDAKIDLLTNQGENGLISIDGLIDRNIIDNTINYLGENWRDVRNEIRRNKYDLFIELPVSLSTFHRLFRNMLFVKSAGIKNAFGWQIASVKTNLKTQEKYLHFNNERDRLLKILEKNGLINFGIKFPFIFKEENNKLIENIIKENGLTDKSKNIGFVVGAKRPQNRWPVEYFIEVAEYLQKNGKYILLVGSKEDFELAKNIKGNNVFNFCGELTPIETALLLKSCRFTISNDTGPMHLSYAVGTPVIALFSSRDYPGRWYPPENGVNKVFRNFDLHCTMCFSEICKNNICMKNLSVDLVIKSLIPFFKEE